MRHQRPDTDQVGKVISRIGKEASIVVEMCDEKTGRQIKYASAHDLRRSCGERWSVRVMPKHLMMLMRHENIETTMKFYVGKNAIPSADAVWNAYQLVENPIVTHSRGATGGA